MYSRIIEHRPTLAALSLGVLASCAAEPTERRSLGLAGDREAESAPNLSQIEPSTIWPVTLDDGHLHISINAEEAGRKTFYNFDYTDGTWWGEDGADFDADLPGDHPWKQLSLVDGMRPWGSSEGGQRIDGPMTAGYTYTGEDGTDMFTFMNRDKFWVMCTANCEQHGKELLDEFFSGHLDRLAQEQPEHPWARLRNDDGGYAWAGDGITAAFQHQSGDFYLFNRDEYWVLSHGTPAGDGSCWPYGEERFGCLYPAQTASRQVSDLTHGYVSEVTAAIALAPLDAYPEHVVLVHGKTWLELDAQFQPNGYGGKDVSNLLSCLRERPIVDGPLGDACELLPVEVDVPWDCGEGYPVTQGNQGSLTHTGKERYAFDFGAPEGTEVRAVKGGVVDRIRIDSTSGGCDISHANDANYVVIDHGDGTSSLYLHLQGWSSELDVGDPVQAGDVIGRVGSTGYVCGAHLHFQVQEQCDSWYCQSLPTEFTGQDGVPGTWESPVGGC